MIDLHTHLAPGVDDGARSLDAALGVLARFAADGVRAIVCTPHARASAVARGQLDIERVRDAYDRLRAAAPAELDIRLGREVMLDEPGVDLAAVPELRLGGGTAMLVEFPHGPVPVAAERELARLCGAGLVPVLAHPERHPGADVAAVQAWRAIGVVVQVDATTLAAPTARGDRARALVAAGAADVLASDNHADARSLTAARAWLAERGEGPLAELLTAENPARLLAGVPLSPPPPAPALGQATGGFTNLTAWLRARLGRGGVRSLSSL